MLSKPHRIARPGEFRATMKAGRRRGGALLVTHSMITDDTQLARFGFVVSRAVGGAVQRNLVKRRLRALSAERIAAGLGGVDVVVRALPAAAAASVVELGAELDRGLAVNR